MYSLSVAERLSVVFAVCYVPRGIDSSLLLSCISCKVTINGRGRQVKALPKAAMSMCTHFPAVIDISERLTLLNLDNARKAINSMRAAVEQRGVAALQCGILDNRRSAKDKVELLSQHPGSEIFVANRFLWRLLDSKKRNHSLALSPAMTQLSKGCIYWLKARKITSSFDIPLEAVALSGFQRVGSHPRLKLPRVVLSQAIATIVRNR